VTHLALGSGREFDRIRAIAEALGADAVGLGDDCALLPEPAGVLALSTDVSVEGVHFRRGWLSLQEIGWRAAASALSDLAGEGAAAIGVLCAVTAPADASEADLTALMRGAGNAAAAVGARVLGGDLSRGAAWSVAVTVIGQAARPVTRADASAGDAIWVTGKLGAARAALVEWQAGRVPATAARMAFARPLPRIEAGCWLASHGARAMLDLSDGLAGDLPHLAAASGVALDIDLDLVPVAPEAADAAHAAGEAPERFAAEAGEDYELLVALPAEFGSAQALAFRQACALPLTRIGSVTAGSGVRFRLAGSAVELRGYDHFR
jgi:thiamine-monophosphate kinase